MDILVLIPVRDLLCRLAPFILSELVVVAVVSISALYRLFGGMLGYSLLAYYGAILGLDRFVDLLLLLSKDSSGEGSYGLLLLFLIFWLASFVCLGFCYDVFLLSVELSPYS